MEGDPPDPFKFLIKLSLISESQEEQLQNEFPPFVEPILMTSSSEGITMVSPPETKFDSLASDSNNAKQPPPPPGTAVGDPPDPLEFLIKLSMVSESQEEILQNGFESFVDSNPILMTSLSDLSPSELPEGMTMISPPDAKFYNSSDQYYSLASDSDNAKQPHPPPGTAVRSGSGDGVLEVEGESSKCVGKKRKAVEIIDVDSDSDSDETLENLPKEKIKVAGMEQKGKTRKLPSWDMWGVNKCASLFRNEGKHSGSTGSKGVSLYKNGKQGNDVTEQIGKTKKLPSPMIQGVIGASLMELVESMKLVGEPNDDPAPDFFEIAKKRGVVFPRPRWWPPEGYD